MYYLYIYTIYTIYIALRLDQLGPARRILQDLGMGVEVNLPYSLSPG